ncbi:MAG: M48 family metallopeptidase [Nitrospira sp.]|nr:M48 family metallopeptidase [Nitrospira sp.]
MTTPTMRRTDWPGTYFGGHAPQPQRASINLMPTGLQIRTDDGKNLWWPYEDIRQTQGFYVGQQVRLERGEQLSEALVVSDTAFLAAVHRVAPERAKHFHDPARRDIRRALTVLAALAVIAISAALYMWAIPALATVVVSHVPVTWEERLGEGIIQKLAPPSKQCTEPKRLQAINQIVTALAATLPDHGYTFQVLVVSNPTVNALAAPGGYIVLFKGLLDRSDSAEELAGVLAHEMQHVIQRHGTRALLQRASIGILLAAMTGDVSSAATFGVGVASTLGTLSYSRRAEEEADTEAMRMLLASRVDPSGMILFFEKLQRKHGNSPEAFKYLSSHPAAEDRITNLQALSRTSHDEPRKLLPDFEWRDMDEICLVRPGS